MVEGVGRGGKLVGCVEEMCKKDGSLAGVVWYLKADMTRVSKVCYSPRRRRRNTQSLSTENAT